MERMVPAVGLVKRLKAGRAGDVTDAAVRRHRTSPRAPERRFRLYWGPQASRLLADDMSWIMRALYSARDARQEPSGAVAMEHGSSARPVRRIVVAFEPPEPPRQALAMATELSLHLGAEVLIACAIEWHPRCGGAENADAVRRNVSAAVERMRAAGIAASGRVAIALVGDGPGIVAQGAVAFEPDLVVVAAPRRRRLLRAIGLDLAGRPVRTCRVPVMVLPNEAGGDATSGAGRRGRPRLRVVAPG
jgi:nucleotide-binding universal stress UspA family protein